MEKYRKSLAILLVVTLALSLLAGCGQPAAPSAPAAAPAPAQAPSQPASAEVKKIGVCMQNTQASFTLLVMAGALNYADTAMPEGYEVVLMNADQKADVQVSQVETLIADGVSAIVINPVDKAGSAPCIQACADAGIPVITINTIVDNQDLVAAHVGADDYVAGTLQMEKAVELIGGKGNVAVLHGTLGHSAQVQRWQAYQDVAAKHEGVTIVADQDTDWMTDNAQSITENWLQSGMDIDAIVCNNDEIAMGAVNAIEASGMHGKIQVVGIDAIKQVLDMIKAGTCAATYDQDALAQGTLGVTLAIEAIEGKPIENTYVDFIEITPDTIDEFLAIAAKRDEILAKYI